MCELFVYEKGGVSADFMFGGYGGYGRFYSKSDRSPKSKIRTHSTKAGKNKYNCSFYCKTGLDGL